ncbi:hypothetical protein ABK040_013582 [Willaertia magna]
MSSFSQKPSYLRFEMDAEEVDHILQYFQNRAIQILHKHDFYWDGNYTLVDDWGVMTKFMIKNDETQEYEPYYNVYVKASHRSKGHMSKWLEENKDKKIVTVKDCNTENYFKKKGISYKIWDKPQDWPEYLAVEKAYGDHCAERTKVHLINHIDEGLFILKKIGASEEAQRAYCLHPLIQGDSELLEFYENELSSKENVKKWDMKIITLALEYRNIANAYLSHCPSSDTFKLSPIREVNQMLIADKIQNRKDFEKYHKGTHPKTDRLEEYFGQWLRRLEISEEMYKDMVNDIYRRVGGSERFWAPSEFKKEVKLSKK